MCYQTTPERIENSENNVSHNERVYYLSHQPPCRASSTSSAIVVLTATRQIASWRHISWDGNNEAEGFSFISGFVRVPVESAEYIARKHDNNIRPPYHGINTSIVLVITFPGVEQIHTPVGGGIHTRFIPYTDPNRKYIFKKINCTHGLNNVVLHFILCTYTARKMKRQY